MRINNTSDHEVRLDYTPIAKVDGTGQIWLWPEGIGHGVAITMTISEWLRVSNSVESALGVAGLTRQQRDLVGYRACEGVVGDDE